MDDEIEVSAQELQQMLIDGKISSTQMVHILRENLGDENVMRLLGSLMKDAYGNIDLSKPVPCLEVSRLQNDTEIN